jgi:hypothetical protein
MAVKRTNKFRFWIRLELNGEGKNRPYIMKYGDSNTLMSSLDGEPYDITGAKLTDFSYIIMQYINIKAKHNIDMYDDDVIKINRTDDTHGNSWADFIVADYELNNILAAMNVKSTDCEIIGNIHENPDLEKIITITKT